MVLAAMTAHTGLVGVQRLGCQVLANLAFNNADNKTAIVAAGGIRVVLAAMKAHDSEEGMQEAGCWNLAYLACNTDNQTAIATAGGISVVLAAAG